MCGFAGILTRGPVSGDDLRGRASAMITPIVHRGPDDSGVWTDAEAGVALGFRRLAIVDLSEHGHQPMSSPSGRFTMVFNGEIFNYADMRTELSAAGYVF